MRAGVGSAGRRVRRYVAAWLVAALIAVPAVATQPPGDIDPMAPLTFGILPIGGPAESLEAWQPMLDDLHKALDRPIRAVSVTTYEGIAQAISEQRVDIAFLSGRLALDAVTRQNMQVIGRLTRGDGSRGYNAVLLVAADSPLRTPDQLFARPGKWRFARGEALSVSGYLVPETQLFAARGLTPIRSSQACTSTIIRTMRWRWRMAKRTWRPTIPPTWNGSSSISSSTHGFACSGNRR